MLFATMQISLTVFLYSISSAFDTYLIYASMTTCPLSVLNYTGYLFGSITVSERWPISSRSSTRCLHLHSLNSIRFLSSNHDRNLRPSNNFLLLCPSHYSNFVNSSLFVQVVILWNVLPFESRISTSLIQNER